MSFYFNLEEAEGIIEDLYSIDLDVLDSDQADAITRVTSWLVLMLQDADDSPERGQ